MKQSEKMSSTHIQKAQIKRFLYQKAASKRIPLSTNFELTPLCNFNCRMCYIHQSEQQVKKHNRSPMKLEEWIRLAEEMKEQGVLYILLTGGEPLLWPDFRKLYEKLYSMGFLLSINTNGSLIDESWISFFKSMPPQRINITLYGYSDETYQSICGVREKFGSVLKAVEQLKHAGVFVKLNCSVTPDNEKDYLPILDYASENAIPIESSTYMYPPVRRDKTLPGNNNRFTPEESAAVRLRKTKHELGEDAYIKFLEKLLEGTMEPMGFEEECLDSENGKISCMAGKASCWVTWDGYLSLCGMIPDYRVDIRDLSFDKGWKEIVEMGDSIRLSATCNGCSNKELCNVCAASAYAETGSCEGVPHYLCETVHEIRKLAKLELNKLNKPLFNSANYSN